MPKVEILNTVMVEAYPLFIWYEKGFENASHSSRIFLYFVSLLSQNVKRDSVLAYSMAHALPSPSQSANATLRVH